MRYLIALTALIALSATAEDLTDPWGREPSWQSPITERYPRLTPPRDTTIVTPRRPVEFGEPVQRPVVCQRVGKTVVCNR